MARTGNAPRQRSCKSARPSFVPSASTTTVPNQPGSTSQVPPGLGPGPTLFGTEIRSGLPLEEGRMLNEDRWTHRTTMWCPPCGLEICLIRSTLEKLNGSNIRLRLHPVLQQLEVRRNLLAPGGDIDVANRVPAPHRPNNPVEVRGREGQGRQILRQVARTGVRVIQVLRGMLSATKKHI